ncbi:MAG: hypothetical protein WBW04_13090, partial [Nitrolancea sp.]
MNGNQIRPDEYWVVELNGWTEAFDAVGQPPIWDFFHHEDRHFLRSSRFADITDASEVIETAIKLVDKINFAARRTRGSRLHLSFEGTVTRVNADGTTARTVLLGARLVVGVSLFGGDLMVGDDPAKVPKPIQEVLASFDSPEVDRA